MSVDQSPQVYDGATDTIVPVTQKWCDDATKAMGAIAAQRGLARWVLTVGVLMALVEKARELGMK